MFKRPSRSVLLFTRAKGSGTASQSIGASRRCRAAAWTLLTLASALCAAADETVSTRVAQPQAFGINNPERTAAEMTQAIDAEALRRGGLYEFNTLPTALPVSRSPAYADLIVDGANNFLPCKGGPFALCFYSGPEGPLPCRVDGPLDTNAECTCIEVPYGNYFVDILSILDQATYLKTVEACGLDGSRCSTTNSAPVCDIINADKLFPGADMISVFSFNCARELSIGQTACHPGVYAGCMTAPCYRQEDGSVRCLCPTYSGNYQVGQTFSDGAAGCELGDGLVWSASNNINTPPPDRPPFTLARSNANSPEGAPKAGNAPVTNGCVPDSPDPDKGCPLWPVPTDLGPEDPLCQLACAEYAQCGTGLTQTGFTCDATLCTAGCNDLGLVGAACAGLGSCSKHAILAVEEQAGCSCCASQICGCSANAATEAEIFVLNQRQRDAGIVPQCDINGTLCGRPPPAEQAPAVP